MTQLNVEIKARCDDQTRIRAILMDLRADFRGIDHQLDTYFNVPAGRLKLREGDIENHLIFYDREDQSDPKESHVTLFPNPPGSALKEILKHALGVLACVEKSREIYFIENVKFHLDTVVDLGTFVEIEAIDADGSIGKQTLSEQCKGYISLLGLCANDFIPQSYADMLLQGHKP